MTRHPIFMSLPHLLAIDAATCGAMGLALIGLTGPAASWTAIPAPILFWAGIVLLPVAAFMAAVSRLAAAPAWAVHVIVFGNVAWSALSIALPLAGMFSPNLLGGILLAGQAAAVLALAGLEFLAARRSSRAFA